MGNPPHLRISDRDREEAVSTLQAAYADGRLSVEELAERVDVAYSARTAGELEVVTADLPAAAKPRAPVRRAPFWPGERPFSESFVTSAPRSGVVDGVLGGVAPLLARCGYTMASHDDRAVVFEREKRPFWTIVAAVCVPPFGFVALLHRSRSRIVVTATEADTGTAVTVYGTAPLNVRRGFAELRDA